jgi:hypothetical protein
VLPERRVDDSQFVEGKAPMMMVGEMPLSTPNANSGYEISEYRSIYEEAKSSEYEISDYKSIYDK